MRIGQKAVVRAAIVAIVAFVVLRLVALPPQLETTPYHDATVGADVLRVLFLQIPRWVLLVGGAVFVVVVVVPSRKSSRNANCAPEGRNDA
jgi:hypothetical protein